MEYLQKALDQLASYGLQVNFLDTSGKLVRVAVDGDKGKKKSGWYVAHEFTLSNGSTVIVGRFGNWKDSDEPRKFEADFTFSEQDRIAYKEKQAAHRARVQDETRRANAQAAKRANDMSGSLADHGNSDYLKRKQVRGFGLYYGKGDTVFVPVQQHGRGLAGFQVINPDGSKKFLTGTEKQGGYHWIGADKESDILLVAEGYATGASLFEATGYPCFVAFDAGNLVHVAQVVRKRWPKKRIIICADDDHATDNNPGMAKAAKAANAVAALVAKPVFIDSAGRTDFNDMHIEQGLPAVAAVIDTLLQQPEPVYTPQQAPPPDEGDWQDQLRRNRDGGLLSNLFNTYTILANHPQWQGVIARDEFAARIVCRGVAPFGGEGNRPWTDTDDMRTVAWLTKHMSCSPQTKTVVEAVQMVAEDNSFHPVREFIQAEAWDGTKRLGNLFIDYFGAKPDLAIGYSTEQKEFYDRQCEYLRLAGIKFMVSAVARVMRPGCKVDTVLILEGTQGLQKSTALKVLAGEWFTDTPFNLGDKDAFQSISGKWIVELAELDSFNKSESTRAKAFFSSSIDNYRPAYGRRNQDYPRQCVFVGTTNQHEYLRDASGNRRYWPVECQKVDIKALQRDRVQLWAEALHMYHDKVKWWPTPEEMPLFADQQERRQIDDPWMEEIEEYLEQPGRMTSERKITINELLDECLGIERGRTNERAEAIRVGRCLAALGYIKRQNHHGQKPRRYYEKLSTH